MSKDSKDGNNPDMKEECKRALLASDSNNVVINYLTAVKYRIHDAMDRLLDRIRRDIVTVGQTLQFLTLPVEYVLVFLDDTSLNVKSELDVFFIALAWINHSKEERTPQAGKVLNKVRFVYIEPEDIIRYVEPNAHLFTGREGREALINVYRHKALKASGLVTSPQSGKDFYMIDPVTKKSLEKSFGKNVPQRAQPVPAEEPSEESTQYDNVAIGTSSGEEPSAVTDDAEEPREGSSEQGPSFVTKLKKTVQDYRTSRNAGSSVPASSEKTRDSRVVPDDSDESSTNTEKPYKGSSEQDPNFVTKAMPTFQDYRTSRYAGSDIPASPEKTSGTRVVSDDAEEPSAPTEESYEGSPEQVEQDPNFMSKIKKTVQDYRTSRNAGSDVPASPEKTRDSRKVSDDKGKPSSRRSSRHDPDDAAEPSAEQDPKFVAKVKKTVQDYRTSRNAGSDVPASPEKTRDSRKVSDDKGKPSSRRSSQHDPDDAAEPSAEQDPNFVAKVKKTVQDYRTSRNAASDVPASPETTRGSLKVSDDKGTPSSSRSSEQDPETPTNIALKMERTVRNFEINKVLPVQVSGSKVVNYYPNLDDPGNDRRKSAQALESMEDSIP